jgi:arylsulfatase A-like enzyme
LILQNNSGRPLALRDGDWMLIQRAKSKNHNEVPYELYNLATDLIASKNLAAEYPDRVAELKNKLEAEIAKNQ